MDTEAPVLQRPRRASKRPPLADDFIDNIDIEIEAIESLPPTTVRPALAAPHPEDGPRKRGRPRKYPLAPPPLPDVQPVKRPRGSGKHQRAAAGSIGGTYLTGTSTGGGPTESGVTSSAAISAAPSVTVLPSVAPPTARGLEGRKNILGTPAFSFAAELPATAVVVENGHGTPHFPPQDVQDARQSDCDDSPSSHVPTEVKNETIAAIPGPRSVENTPKTTGLTRNGRAERAAERQNSEEEAEDAAAANGPADGSLASADAAAAFTPRPRNRRKGGVPTKTE